MRRSITPTDSDDKNLPAFTKNMATHSSSYWLPSEKRTWTAALMCGTAIIYTARTIMPVCIVEVADEMKWDKKESGTVLSAFFWGYMTTQILGGYLSDRVGGERVLLVASVLWSSVTFCTPLIIRLSTYTPFPIYVIVAFRVLLGVSQGVHFPSTTSLVSRKVHTDERSLTISLIATGANCGTLLSGSVGSFLMEQFGWQKPFYVIGCSGLLWAVVMYRCLIRKQHSAAESPLLSAKAMDMNSNINTSTPVPWLRLFSRCSFWALLISNYCSNNGFYILLSWLPTFFHENFPDAKSWVFNVVPWLVIVPCNVSGGWLADRMIKAGFTVTFVRKLIATVLFSGTALFLVLISYMDTYHSTLLCMTLALACCGFYSPSLSINPVDLAPNHAGAVFGVLNTTSAIPGFVGVYMAGYILETTKSWSAVFNQTAAICVFGNIVFLLLGTAQRII